MCTAHVSEVDVHIEHVPVWNAQHPHLPPVMLQIVGKIITLSQNGLLTERACQWPLSCTQGPGC